MHVGIARAHAKPTHSAILFLHFRSSVCLNG